MKMNLKSVKNRLKDETLDLSLCDLEEVPVREIATIRKASHLDLSNNLLVSLPNTFATLTQIVKLDLSRNKLTEIPENFGEMKQLKSLDLYANQISRLPLSLSELKNLRWLDLKENPLTPAVASVAGPCSNMSECQACARNIVAYLSNVKMTINEEKLRRLNAAVGNSTDANGASSKKESKKKKKKSGEKENKKNSDKNGAKPENTEPQINKTETRTKELISSRGCTSKKRSIGSGLCRSVFSIFVRLLFICFALALVILILPVYSKQHSEMVFKYFEDRTGLSITTFHKNGVNILNHSLKTVVEWSKDVYQMVNEYYEGYFNEIATASTSAR